jgi:hypothetical protein
MFLFHKQAVWLKCTGFYEQLETRLRLLKDRELIREGSLSKAPLKGQEKIIILGTNNYCHSQFIYLFLKQQSDLYVPFS